MVEKIRSIPGLVKEAIDIRETLTYSNIHLFQSLTILLISCVLLYGDDPTWQLTIEIADSVGN